MKRHALFVGVDDYADPTIQNLRYPSEDAAEMASVFRRLLKFDRVEKLINPGHAPDVVDAVKALARGLGPGDLFLVFFAGHGFRVKDSHVLVCAKDEYAELANERVGLSVGWIKERMRGPWNQMLVLDACQNDIRATRGGDTGVTARDLELIHATAPVGGDSGWQIVVTSCSEGQRALEVSDLGHGLFTSAFLDSVTSLADARRRIDLETLRSDLGDRMGRLIVRYHLSGEQVPLFTMPPSAADIVLLDGVAPVPDAFSPVRPVVPALVVCPVCGKKNEPKDTFKCRECGRDDLCLDHRDGESFLCSDCTAKKACEEAERRARESAESLAQDMAEIRAREDIEFRSQNTANRMSMRRSRSSLWGDVRESFSSSAACANPVDPPSIPGYRIERALGFGWQGRVWLGIDPAGVFVVIKGPIRQVDELRATYALVQGLKNVPHIAPPSRIVEVPLAGGSCEVFAVSRHAQGKPLDEWLDAWLKDHRNPTIGERTDIALEIGRQIAEALDATHEKSVMHLDVKPENIVVADLPDGEISVQLIDFELAHRIDPDGEPIRGVGTAEFIAPEIWIGRRPPSDGSADQYSLACVLYWIISGKTPFAGMFEKAMKRHEVEWTSSMSASSFRQSDFLRSQSKLVDDLGCAVVAEVPAPSCPGLDEGRNRALLRALSKNPADRYPSCSMMIDAIRCGEAVDALSVIAAGVSFNLRRIPAKGTQPAFWMGETQVTQKLWTAVMGRNPSESKGDDLQPVETISWNDCQDFLKKLNALDEVRRSGFVFRLPTEDEWEHACRAGSTGDYCRLADGTEITAEGLGRVAWFNDRVAYFNKTFPDTMHPVGRKEPNAWGLYDMHGNVWEWTKTADGDHRVFRGGSFNCTAGYCTAGYRRLRNPDFRSWSLGLRLAASGRAAAPVG